MIRRDSTFDCKQFDCRLAFRDCLERQASEPGKEGFFRYCASGECRQGKAIAEHFATQPAGAELPDPKTLTTEYLTACFDEFVRRAGIHNRRIVQLASIANHGEVRAAVRKLDEPAAPLDEWERLAKEKP